MGVRWLCLVAALWGLTVAGVKYPENFHFGAGTAPYQVEGNNVLSDFWVLDHITDPQWYRHPAGDANDFYLRYEEDLDLVASFDFNSFRLGIEWARVEPVEGTFSLSALDYYAKMIRAVTDRGMRPFLVLSHMSAPVWIIEKGGWASNETPPLFERYAAKVIEHLGDLVEYVATINEIAVPRMLQYWIDPNDPEYVAFRNAAAAEFDIAEPSFASWLDCISDNCIPVLLECHRRAQAAIKSIRPELKVGFTVGIQDLQALPGGEANRDAARAATQDEFFLFAAEQKVDFLGIQTYTRGVFDENGVVPPGPDAELTQLGYEYYPEALCGSLSYAHEKMPSTIPLLVTETGLGSANDTRRADYYETSLGCVESSLEKGIDVGGYYAWAAVDCYEWSGGYGIDFGFVSVDRDTLERKVKGPSAEFMKEYARIHGLTTTTPSP